jgi:dTDP-4-dehydrorhamnose reductase
VKVLVIAQDAQIRDALVTQFDLRGRSYQCQDEQWLAAQDGAVVIPSDTGIVISAISLEQPQGPHGDSSLEHIQQIATACGHAGTGLIHLSSSQVFDGIDGGRHRESDDAQPASRAGASLMQAEQIIAEHCSRHIILRTGLLFSAIGDNALTSLLEQFKSNESLVLSNSGSSCPIHTSDLARVVSAMVDQLSCGGEVWGTYHYHSSDPASRFKFTEAVLAAVSQFSESLGAGLELKSVDKIDATWSQPLLNCEKILNTFGIKQLPWRMLVVQAVKQLVGSSARK